MDSIHLLTRDSPHKLRGTDTQCLDFWTLQRQRAESPLFCFVCHGSAFPWRACRLRNRQAQAPFMGSGQRDCLDIPIHVPPQDIPRFTSFVVDRCSKGPGGANADLCRPSCFQTPPQALCAGRLAEGILNQASIRHSPRNG